MQYEVVGSYGKFMLDVLEGLKERVNEMCQAGWKPQGGISIAIEKQNSPFQYYACQAMVK